MFPFPHATAASQTNKTDSSMSAGDTQQTRQGEPTERMDAVAQTLAVLLLLLVLTRTSNSNRCYEEWELSKVAGRKLESHYPQPPEPPAVAPHDSPFACPLDLYTHHRDLENRSLSPWRYVWRNMKDHYPATYVEAQCLCSGCIMIKNKGTPVLSHDYNSVPINQTRVFLKRERCSDGYKYYLKPVSVVVTVGCTCARPRITV